VWCFEKLQLVSIARADRLDSVRKSPDFLNFVQGEKGLSIPESMTQGDLPGAPPSPQSLPRDLQDGRQVRRRKICNTINMNGIKLVLGGIPVGHGTSCNTPLPQVKEFLIAFQAVPWTETGFRKKPRGAVPTGRAGNDVRFPSDRVCQT
jgi:hypothetical protein